MSHFYRLQTINNCHPQDFLILRSQDRVENDSLSWAKFCIEAEKNEILIDPPWPHCKMYRGPLIDQEYAVDYVVDMREHTTLPDIISREKYILVSREAKKVIESLDDFGHQFYETRFFNEQGDVVNKTPYYVMMIRRILDIEKLDLEVDRRSLAFLPTLDELDFIPTLFAEPILKRLISQLPWWRSHKSTNSKYYLSELMLEKMRGAGLTGLDSCIDKYAPRTGESISIV